MNRYIIQYEDKRVLVNIYKTRWMMHRASLAYAKNGTIDKSTHGALGVCYRWWLTPHKPNKVVSVIMMSWDTVNFEILSHELLHAAVHLYTYDEEEEGKIISTENDEEIATIHSDLVGPLLELFDKEKIMKLVNNQKS